MSLMAILITSPSQMPASILLIYAFSPVTSPPMSGRPVAAYRDARSDLELNTIAACHRNSPDGSAPGCETPGALSPCPKGQWYPPMVTSEATGFGFPPHTTRVTQTHSLCDADHTTEWKGLTESGLSTRRFELAVKPRMGMVNLTNAGG